MLRFRKRITKTTLAKLYWLVSSCRIFNIAHQYENLNKRILRFVLGDFVSTYNILMDEVNCVSLYKRRTYNMLILLYKSLFLTKYPIYMKNMSNLRISCYNLRGNYILMLPVPKTSTGGLHSFLLK